MAGELTVYNLWTQLDKNIAEGIQIPEGNVTFKLPPRIVESFTILNIFRDDLVSASDPMHVVAKYHLE